MAVLGDNRDLEELIYIPDSLFWMGDDKGLNSTPAHQVTLSAYKIGRFLVTNDQYRLFVDATGRKWETRDGRRAEKSTCPVVNITWHDACDYCRWLTEKWCKEGRITRDETVHLPNEAQWEKAARGTDKRTYPWGDKWEPAMCNTAELGLVQTTPVGIFPQGRSPYGCLDMAGNVFEWTSSLWGKVWEKPEFKYPYDPNDGRENKEVGDDVLRVLRGGSWFLNRFNARCSYRQGFNTDLWFDRRGFRVAVSPISSGL